MKKMFAMIAGLFVFVFVFAPVFAAGATVNDNTYDGMLERVAAATGATYRTGTWSQSVPTSSVIRIQNKPLFHVSNTDTNAASDSTDYTAISEYEVLWSPNDEDTIMYISRAAGSNDWARLPVVSRIMEIVATDTNTTVDSTDHIATASKEMLWTPNATDSLLYISRAAGSNGWMRVPVATRLFEIVSVNTNANVPDTSAAEVTATAAYQVLLTPNATNGVAFYYSSAAGTNSWKTVAR